MGPSAALAELGKVLNKRKDTRGRFSKSYIDETTVESQECAEMRSMIVGLKSMWPDTVLSIQKDRDKIVTSFAKMYKVWQDNHRHDCNRTKEYINTLLITHGFSTTVREILKRSLPETLRELTDLFVIGSGHVSDLDSRLMESAMLQPDALKRLGMVASGDKDMLPKFVRKDMKVMVILGAECFDSEGHVVHPRGFTDMTPVRGKDMTLIREKLGNPEAFCVVVVAEGYKFHEKFKPMPHHLDGIQVYEPALIDIIVSTHIVSKPYSRGTAVDPPLEERRKPGRDAHILRRPWVQDPETRASQKANTFSLTRERAGVEAAM